MTAVSAHDLTMVRLCKQPGCENEQRTPLIERGPYSGLCDEHYEEMRRKMSEAGRRGMHGKGSEPSSSREQKADALQLGAQLRNVQPEVVSLKEAAQALVQPAAAVDRAAARKSSSDSEYDDAKHKMAAAVRDFQQALANL